MEHFRAPYHLCITNIRNGGCKLQITICSRTRLKRDCTRAETRFGLSAIRTSPFTLTRGGGGQFLLDDLCRLLAAEVSESAVVMVVMLDTRCSEVECKTTGYPLHSHVPPSLPQPCVTVCHQVSTEPYQLYSTIY